MEDKKLLIAGIDPGITTGFAFLGIDGNLLHIGSSKNLDMKSLILESIKFGEVVLAGTDKSKVPRLVDAFATKLGARTVSPKEDIKVYEKRKMIAGFSVQDEHQGDALASALFAYRSMKPLLDKIDFFAEQNKKQEISSKIKRIVVLNGISIRNAASIIERKDDEGQIIEKVLIEKKLSDKDFLRMYDRLAKYRAEIDIVRKFNNKLRARITHLESRAAGTVEQKQSNKMRDFRQDRIKNLEQSLMSKDKKIEEMASIVRKFNNVLSNIGNFYILKKLDTLGINEISFKNHLLNIQRNDILLVENPNIMSEKAVDILKNRVFAIVYKMPVSKKIESSLPFVFINADGMGIQESKHFGFVNKKRFEAEKNKTNWVKKIVDDYKMEKKQLLSW